MQMTKDKIYNNEFYDALSELDVIINYMNITSIFPEVFLEFIKDNKNNNYKFKYDENISLSEQKITKTTKQILAIIYCDYFCTTEEKKELENIWKENDKLNITENNLEQIQKTSNNAMIEYSEPIYKKILKKIKELLKVKRK